MEKDKRLLRKPALFLGLPFLAVSVSFLIANYADKPGVFTAVFVLLMLVIKERIDGTR